MLKPQVSILSAMILMAIIAVIICSCRPSEFTIIDYYLDESAPAIKVDGNVVAESNLTQTIASERKNRKIWGANLKVMLRIRATNGTIGKLPEKVDQAEFASLSGLLSFEIIDADELWVELVQNVDPHVDELNFEFTGF